MLALQQPQHKTNHRYYRPLTRSFLLQLQIKRILKLKSSRNLNRKLRSTKKARHQLKSLLLALPLQHRLSLNPKSTNQQRLLPRLSLKNQSNLQHRPRFNLQHRLRLRFSH